MKKVRKIKMKPKFMAFLKWVGVLLFLVLCLFLFYEKQVHDLTKIGYSREASNRILFSFEKDYVLSIGESGTLNRVFEEDAFLEEYRDKYKKIDYNPKL